MDWVTDHKVAADQGKNRFKIPAAGVPGDLLYPYWHDSSAGDGQYVYLVERDLMMGHSVSTST